MLKSPITHGSFFNLQNKQTNENKTKTKQKEQKKKKKKEKKKKPLKIENSD